MPRNAHTITAEDILPLDQYELIRADKRQEALLRKKLTRLHIGPNATILFETWDSMWLQIHEMLRIEKGGAAQVPDELAAYDPMVPKGANLTATLLFEVEDPVRRDAFLRRIGGVENHIVLQLGADRIVARPEGDVERTREHDGKASAVHFVHFDLSAAQVRAWVAGEGQALVMIDHPEYGHAAMIGAETRSYLARECFG
jgi:hypothetical protein